MHFHKFKCVQWVCHANDTGSMRGVKQDQPPFRYSSDSESELFTGDRLQLQLYKTESIRVIDLHLVTKTDVLVNVFPKVATNTKG